MMNSPRRRLMSTLLAGGAIYSSSYLKCLPEDYFASAGRTIAVGVTNDIITAVFVIPLYEALGLVPPSNNGDGTTDGAGTTDGG